MGTDHRHVGALWLVFIVLLNTACTAAEPATAPTGTPSPGEPAVQDLDSIQSLQDRFEEDAGRVRLILLISPT